MKIIPKFLNNGIFKDILDERKRLEDLEFKEFRGHTLEDAEIDELNALRKKYGQPQSPLYQTPPTSMFVNRFNNMLFNIKMLNDKKDDLIEFTKSYYESPAFKRRLNSMHMMPPKEKPWYDGEEKIKRYNEVEEYVNKRNLEQPNYTVYLHPFNYKAINIKNDNNIKASGAYIYSSDKPNKGLVKINRNYNLNPFGYAHTASHELGHYIDHLITPYSLDNFPTGGFSEYIPALRLTSITYPTLQTRLPYNINSNILPIPALKNVYFNTYTRSIHDSVPSEQFANIMRLRYIANELGIFDSREDKEITRDQVKKLLKYIDYDPYLSGHFTEDELYWLLNNVADNDKYKNSKKDNLISEDIVQKYLT